MEEKGLKINKYKKTLTNTLVIVNLHVIFSLFPSLHIQQHLLNNLFMVYVQHLNIQEKLSDLCLFMQLSSNKRLFTFYGKGKHNMIALCSVFGVLVAFTTLSVRLPYETEANTFNFIKVFIRVLETGLLENNNSMTKHCFLHE